MDEKKEKELAGRFKKFFSKDELKWYNFSDIGKAFNRVSDALEKHVEATEGLSEEEAKALSREQWREEIKKRIKEND